MRKLWWKKMYPELPGSFKCWDFGNQLFSAAVSLNKHLMTGHLHRHVGSTKLPKQANANRGNEAYSRSRGSEVAASLTTASGFQWVTGGTGSMGAPSLSRSQLTSSTPGPVTHSRQRLNVNIRLWCSAFLHQMSFVLDCTESRDRAARYEENMR